MNQAFAINEMRTFPTIEKFVQDKKMKDKIYGFLQTHSYLTEDRVRYCWKGEMTAPKIVAAMNCDDVTVDIVKRTIRLFLSADLIKESTYQKKKIYILNDLQKGDFIYIKTNVLQFLTDTSSMNTIKIYSFLKKKYQQHIDLKFTEDYRFSKAKLLEVIGYSDNNSNNYEMINNILVNLENNGLIEFEQKWVMTGNDNKTQYYFLKKVNDVVIDKQKIRNVDEPNAEMLVKAPLDEKEKSTSVPVGDFKF